MGPAYAINGYLVGKRLTALLEKSPERVD